jgi:hypothetical protein
MYIPFVLVILGVAGCSYIYKDELFGRFGQQEETVDAPEPPVLESGDTTEPADEGELPADVEDTPEVGAEEQLEIMDEGTETSTDGGLPGIGECVCPDQSTTSLGE